MERWICWSVARQETILRQGRRNSATSQMRCQYLCHISFKNEFVVPQQQQRLRHFGGKAKTVTLKEESELSDKKAPRNVQRALTLSEWIESIDRSLVAGVLGWLVTRLLRIGFGHVFTLLGLAVPVAALGMVYPAFGVDPHHTLLRRRTCRGGISRSRLGGCRFGGGTRC